MTMTTALSTDTAAATALTRTELVTRHSDRLDAAVRALNSRAAYSAFTGREPSGLRGDDASAAFDALLGSTCGVAGQAGVETRQDDETSPWTREPLGISYPRVGAEDAVACADAARPAWTALSIDERAAVSIEMVERLFADNVVLGLAAMHTTGQGRGMSQSGSGTNALDRGLEAIAAAWQILSRIPTSATWEQRFGDDVVSLEKNYRIVPLGTALVVACASFPAWNVYPSVFANLMTGNAVILKPHPSSVLQMALAVTVMRETLSEVGCDPDLVQLAVDSAVEPITSVLATHSGVRIVDFTGSPRYGSWVEQNAHQARVYTETAGINSIVIDSFTDPLNEMRAIAGALSLFSAQMCTAPQNIYIPDAGVHTPDGLLTAEEVETGILTAIEAVSASPRRAAAVLGTIQSQNTLRELDALANALRDRATVLRAPQAWEAPGFPDARTTTPLIARVTPEQHDLFAQECFGPVMFLIRVPDARTGLRRAASDARKYGAITAFLYSTDESLIADTEDAFATAGAALTINVTGAMPINFSAAFSDFHVSGLNPAGTATLTDDSFVTGRFRVVQSRRPLRPSHD
ncbi:aldehyde dehydrogenase family protein [Microbacterium sp. H1-D42]|uniref:aldehyde dehydrogenase family protein n=1 Tax=Microbacterium sp. H1-D42 TaxID=2925844 RepID=UPI001F52E40A|nr:aldehyde dehydrogenase family protein [Microbacterium sp. H1-D42]UNK71499.1 aldehyde dehydrogenase family protein [Microbacterium sp. H1-D42]